MITFKEFLALEMPWHPAVVGDDIKIPKQKTEMPDMPMGGDNFSYDDIKLIQGLKKGGKNLALTQKLMRNNSYSIYPVYINSLPLVTNKDEYIRQLVKNEYGDIDWKNSIIFVKIGSSGDPLRGWMNIHTFGHAVWSNGNAAGYEQIVTEINHLGTVAGFKHNPAISSGMNEKNLIQRICSFINIGSCRNFFTSEKSQLEEILDIGELIYEFTAQVARGANLNPKFNDSYYTFDPKTKTAITKVLKNIEGIIINKLNSLKGKVIWDLLEED